MKEGKIMLKEKLLNDLKECMKDKKKYSSNDKSCNFTSRKR